MHNQVQDFLIQHHFTDSLPVEQLSSVDLTLEGELIESDPVERREILVYYLPSPTSNIVLSQPSHIGANQDWTLPEKLLEILTLPTVSQALTCWRHTTTNCVCSALRPHLLVCTKKHFPSLHTWIILDRQRHIWENKKQLQEKMTEMTQKGEW